MYSTTVRHDVEIKAQLSELLQSYRQTKKSHGDLRSLEMSQDRQRIIILTIVLLYHLTKAQCEHLLDVYRKSYYADTNPDRKGVLWGRSWTLLWVININDNVKPRGGY